MCQETSACVVSISYGVVYGSTYVWLEWCPLGCLGHVFSVVRGPFNGLQVGILSFRFPMCTFIGLPQQLQLPTPVEYYF